MSYQKSWSFVPQVSRQNFEHARIRLATLSASQTQHEFRYMHMRVVIDETIMVSHLSNDSKENEPQGKPETKFRYMDRSEVSKWLMSTDQILEVSTHTL